jgi:hypothetical protein
MPAVEASAGKNKLRQRVEASVSRRRLRQGNPAQDPGAKRAALGKAAREDSARAGGSPLPVDLDVDVGVGPAEGWHLVDVHPFGEAHVDQEVVGRLERERADVGDAGEVTVTV